MKEYFPLVPMWLPQLNSTSKKQERVSFSLKFFLQVYSPQSRFLPYGQGKASANFSSVSLRVSTIRTNLSTSTLLSNLESSLTSSSIYLKVKLFYNLDVQVDMYLDF